MSISNTFFKPGHKIGKKYILRKPLGEGGSKEAWEAHDEFLNRDVAFKIIKNKEPNKLIRKGLTQKDLFFREARILSELHHPNIVRIYDANTTRVKYRGETIEVLYIVEELVRGKNLTTRINQGLKYKEVLAMSIQMAEGMEYIHNVKTEEGHLLHGDWKSDNILLQEDQIKITDFGLAGYDSEDLPNGSILTLAPELRDGNRSRLSDIYALGAVYHEMCIGKSILVRSSFKQDNEGLGSEAFREEVIAAQKKGIDKRVRQINPEIGLDLEQVIMKLLHKDPNERIQSAREVKNLLKSIQKASTKVPERERARIEARKRMEDTIEKTDNKGLLGRLMRWLDS
jgi:eukaryotic-like serine/threonine-protein kinase